MRPWAALSFVALAAVLALGLIGDESAADRVPTQLQMVERNVFERSHTEFSVRAFICAAIEREDKSGLPPLIPKYKSIIGASYQGREDCEVVLKGLLVDLFETGVDLRFSDEKMAVHSYPVPVSRNYSVTRRGEPPAFLSQQLGVCCVWVLVNPHSSAKANIPGWRATCIIELDSDNEASLLPLPREKREEFNVVKRYPCTLTSDHGLTIDRVGFNGRTRCLGRGNGSGSLQIPCSLNSIYSNYRYPYTHNPYKASDYDHPKGPLRHFLLGIQILLGALGFARGFYYIFKALPDLFDGGELGTFYLKFFLGIGISFGSGIFIIHLFSI
jgi:hypothetical protein